MFPDKDWDENTYTYYSDGIKLNDGHGTDFTDPCDWTEENGLVERNPKPQILILIQLQSPEKPVF